MTNDKNKLDFNQLKNRKKNTPSTTPPKQKKMYKEVEEVPKEVKKTKIVTTKKVGRKSWKQAGVTYSRIGFDAPIATKQKLKQILATKFFGSSQDEMINIAINDFIKKHSS